MTAGERLVVPRRRVDRFSWERRLRADGGVFGTRLLVLLTLGTWMDADGGSARAGQPLLAVSSGLAERTVRQHLAAAVAEGWLELVQRGHRVGERSVASCYAATVPTGAPVPVDEGSTGVTAPVDPVEDRPSTGTPPPVVVDNEEHHRHPAAARACGQPDQPASDDTTTGAGAPPTTTDQPLLPPRRSTRADHPAAGGEQSKVDEVLAAWIEGQVAAIDATAGVSDLAGLRRHLANRALEEHLDRARQLVDRYPGESPGRLAAVLSGNSGVARQLVDTHRHLRVIDGTGT